MTAKPLPFPVAQRSLPQIPTFARPPRPSLASRSLTVKLFYTILTN